jgi:hypothetical protein
VVSLMDFAKSMSRPAPTLVTSHHRHPPPVAVSRFCRSCGREFAAGGPGTTGRHPVYCSPACRTAARRERGVAYYAANLEKMQARARARPPKGTCSECGKPVHVSENSAPPDRRRCRDCQRARPKQALRESRTCELCGEPYLPGPRASYKPPQRFCSKSCTTAWANGGRPPYTRVRDGDYGTARNARKRRRLRVRAETWDGVSDAQILERDRWRCGICSKRIGKSFKHPHPRSASIDHIIPLSMGGDDTAANKRAAHLACNCGRRNRAGWEQVALIGWLNASRRVAEGWPCLSLSPVSVTVHSPSRSPARTGGAACLR